MKFDPEIHHRRSIRLKGYDYSSGGVYFITICCHDKILRFGTISPANSGDVLTQIVLSEFGQQAYNEWLKLPQRFSGVELDVFQIMPNHMHGIIILRSALHPKNTVWAGLAPAQTPAVNKKHDSTQTQAINQSDNISTADGAGESLAPTLGDIMGTYKSLVAKRCLEHFKISIVSGINGELMGKLWQRNYYEHIIRTEEAYNKISNYIVSNPEKWVEDKFYVTPILTNK